MMSEVIMPLLLYENNFDRKKGNFPFPVEKYLIQSGAAIGACFYQRYSLFLLT